MLRSLLSAPEGLLDQTASESPVSTLADLPLDSVDSLIKSFLSSFADAIYSMKSSFGYGSFSNVTAPAPAPAYAPIGAQLGPARHLLQADDLQVTCLECPFWFTCPVFFHTH